MREHIVSVCLTWSIDVARNVYPRSNKDNELHDHLTITEKEECRKTLQVFLSPLASDNVRSERDRDARGSLIPAVRRPFTLRSALAIATGRASRSLMCPAVERHHRSSRALTQDAPTLRDLLIFEIACPGMFIWCRGCRRESPVARLTPFLPFSFTPPSRSFVPSSNLPADISQLLPSRPFASWYPFFRLLCIRPTTSPFFPPFRLVSTRRRRQLSSSVEAPTEKNASKRTRPYWHRRLLPPMYITIASWFAMCLIHVYQHLHLVCLIKILDFNEISIFLISKKERFCWSIYFS